MGIPFYVERSVNGKIEFLKVDGWNYAEWDGCFCMLSDKPT